MKLPFVKHSIKLGLRALGLEVRRVKGAPYVRVGEKSVTPVDSQAAGLVLELIGVSGVGKSTLLRYCMPHLRSAWIADDEFAASLFPNGIRFRPREISLDGVEAGVLQGYVKRKLKFDARLVTTDQRLASISSHINRLRFHLWAEDEFPYGVVMNEGLVMNFGEELVNHVGESDRIKSMLGRRLLVSLSCDDDGLILHRIRTRHREQPGHTGYMGLSDDEVVSCVQKQRKQMSEWIDALEPHLGGVLRLNITDGQSACVSSVLALVERAMKERQ